MNLLRAQRTAIAFLLALAGHSAQSEVLASLTFIQPTGTATTTDVIPMWVRLSLAPNSDAVSLSTTTDSAYIDWYCENGGFSDCSPDEPDPTAAPSPYVAAPHFGANSWFELTQRPAFILNPGESVDLHIVNLTPRSGTVPAGFYQHQQVGLSIYGPTAPEDDPMFPPAPHRAGSGHLRFGHPGWVGFARPGCQTPPCNNLSKPSQCRGCQRTTD